jgi:hypothetical protein
MADYGEVLDDFDYDGEKQTIYDIFLKYYNYPSFTKIKDENNFSMYAIKIYCLLSKECRYVIIFTAIDNNEIGEMEDMQNLKWVSLQTRTLPPTIEANTHVYEPRQEGKIMEIINRFNTTKEASFYKCDTLPIKVTLLHTKKKDQYSYQDKGRLISALETWETIITFDDKII